MDKLLTPIAIKASLCVSRLVNRTAFFCCIATDVDAVSWPNDSFPNAGTEKHIF